MAETIFYGSKNLVGIGNMGIGTTNPATALDVYTGTMNASSVTATSLSGGGSAITALNMANVGSGTLSVIRGGTGVTASTGTGSVVLSADPTFTGTVAAGLTTIIATPAAAANVLTVRGSSTTGNVVQFSNTAGGTFIMTSAGRVGIGTTAPQSSLHVASNVQIGVGQNGTRLQPAVLTMNTLSISQNGTATTPQTLIRLQWKEDSFDLGPGEGCGIAFALSLNADNVHYDGCRIASFKETGVDAEREQALTFWTSTDGGVTAPAERMRITSLGRVGIGITSAVDVLDVSASQDTVRIARFCNTKNDGGSQDTCFVHTDQPFSTAVTAWTGSALTVTTYPQNNSTNNGYIAKFGTSASDGSSMDAKVVISSGFNTLGFVGIGTVSPVYALEVVGTFRTSTTMTFSGGSGGGVRYVQVDNNGTVSYASSDARLKTNITPISYGLDAVLQLNPVTFNWKDSNVGGAYTDMGFIAQEVEPIIPEVVRVDSDGVYSLNLPNINAVLTKAIQELSTKNTDLEAKLQTAQNDIDLLESRLAAIEALISTNTSADTSADTSTGTRAEALLSQV